MKQQLIAFLLCVAGMIPLCAQKKALVCGAGGFIGHHLVAQYKKEGFWVRGVDIKYPEFGASEADEFMIADLRTAVGSEAALTCEGDCFDEVCQLAANMGGMGYIAFHDAEILHDSVLINVQVLEACRRAGVKKVFFSSSACVYPERNQLDPLNPFCQEDSAYPADPDTEYGWEKLFSERLYLSYARDYGMDVRIARFHNIFGPQGAWKGGREKAPAAICRKIAAAEDGGVVEVWGTGDQTRSFLYIDECIEGVRRLMQKENPPPIVNLGSEEMISINDLVKMVAEIAGKQIIIKNVPGPEGVRGRTSDNTRLFEVLHWAPSQPLRVGMEKLYAWVLEQQPLKQPTAPSF